MALEVTVIEVTVTEVTVIEVTATEATVVCTVVDLAVMTTDTIGLQGALLSEVVVIILLGARPMVERQEGRGPDHFHTLRMVAQTGNMCGALGKAGFC